MTDHEVLVVGCGPHGMAAAAHLHRAGVTPHVVGEPMTFWDTMPTGMLLRSNLTATCIAEYDGPLSLASYCAERGLPQEKPVTLQRFLDYGRWVATTVVPEPDRRRVTRIAQQNGHFRVDYDQGAPETAHRVVVAAGIAGFEHRPEATRALPSELVSHTADHADPAAFAGQRVAVVGGGQSALEWAALLHENGAEPEVLVRADHLVWLHGGVYHRRLGRLAPLVYAPTDVGPMGLSRVVAVPRLFNTLPRPVGDLVAHRCIRPAGAEWLKARLVDVPIRLRARVRESDEHGGRARLVLEDGSALTVDHVLTGTGYRPDITRYDFLDRDLLARIHRSDGYPVLGAGMEASVPRLHFLGAVASRSQGPTMRFVAGGWYGARELTAHVSPRATSAAA